MSNLVQASKIGNHSIENTQRSSSGNHGKNTKRIAVLGPSGDLGAGLLTHLNRLKLPTVTLSRAGSPLPGLLFPELNRQITFNSQQEFSAQLPLIFELASAAANCVGMTRPTQPDPRVIKSMILANVLIPLEVNRVASQFGAEVLHVSTGELDLLAQSELPPLRDIAMDPENACRHRAEILAFLLAEIDKRIYDPYALSKRALEYFCRECPKARVLRLSNFFGPGYKRAGLIPRMILARLRGDSISVPNQKRNWAYRDELNYFLVSLLQQRKVPHDHIVWVYGSFDSSTREIARELRHLLPTCYGQIEVLGGEEDLSNPTIKRISDYSLSPAERAPSLRDALWDTCRYWRVSCDYLLDDFSVLEGEVAPFAQFRLRGGSIAKKALDGRRRFTKSARHPGYEGAGRPKVLAEIEFYEALKGPGRTALRHLFPAMLSHRSTVEEARVTLECIGDGTTVAHAVSRGHPFPYTKVASLVSRAFQASYLGDLRRIDHVEGGRLLSTCYLARAHDRLLNFFTIADRHSLSPEFARLLAALSEGKDIMIDGHSYCNTLRALTELETDDRVRQDLAPRALGSCGHGDMTVLNMVWTNGNADLRLIDPRGFVGRWDPIYDLSKLAFSLSGFAASLTNSLDYICRGESFESTISPAATSMREARRWLDDWLLSEPAFADLRAVEPHLMRRLRLGEATHYLADVTYRYAQGRDSHAAMVVLLLGIVHMGTLFSELGNHMAVATESI